MSPKTKEVYQLPPSCETFWDFQRPGAREPIATRQSQLLLDIFETTVFLAVTPRRDVSRNNRYERRATIAGSKSCPQDRGAASVVAIGPLLKGLAGAGFEPATFGL